MCPPERVFLRPKESNVFAHEKSWWDALAIFFVTYGAASLNILAVFLTIIYLVYGIYIRHMTAKKMAAEEELSKRRLTMSDLKVIAASLMAVIALAAPLTRQSEGLRLTAYRDPVGIPTICYGHTGADVRMGQIRTKAECEALLEKDLAVALVSVDRCAGPLPLHPRAAFADFTLNVGGGAFCRSGIAKKARAGDIAGACADLSKWIYAKKKVLPGLVTRRGKTQLLCDGSDAA